MQMNVLKQFSSPLQNVIPFKPKREAVRFGSNPIPTPPESPPREKVVAVYGGASVKEGTPLYKFAFDVGKELAKSGFGVLTGGGPGIMKAAAEGAESENGYTIGMAMPFIGEQPFMGNDELHQFNTFSERIDDGYEARSALTAAVPGGIGTLQELTKKAAELYTNKTLFPSQKQIVLFDLNGYYKKFIEYLKEGPIAHGLMNSKVLDLFKVVDKIEDGIALLKKSAQEVPWTPGLKNKKPNPFIVT